MAVERVPMSALTSDAPPPPAGRHVRLVRHTLFNLVGLGAPLFVALVSIPMLLQELGVPRFGLLTLIWAVVSYFSLFDLGLGRALTQSLARILAQDPPGDPVPTVGTALTLMTVIDTNYPKDA